MPTLSFKIVTTKREPLDIGIDNIRKFPMHESHLLRADYFMLHHEFKPAIKTDVVAYADFLAKHFKKEYNAYSVECSIPQEYLKS
jgi:hypothetical protein